LPTAFFSAGQADKIKWCAFRQAFYFIGLSLKGRRVWACSGRVAILHNVTIRLFLFYSATLCNLAWGCFFWRVFLLKRCAALYFFQLTLKDKLFSVEKIKCCCAWVQKA
jgi:hypothetical protein